MGGLPHAEKRVLGLQVLFVWFAHSELGVAGPCKHWANFKVDVVCPVDCEPVAKEIHACSLAVDPQVR